MVALTRQGMLHLSSKSSAHRAFKGGELGARWCRHLLDWRREGLTRQGDESTYENVK